MSTHSVHQFAEKVALITDGTSAVGRAVALQLALNGAYVIVGQPADQPADPSIEELQSMGTLASSVVWDARTDEGAKTLAAGAAERFERVDFLVNCLKYAGESAFLETEAAAVRDAIDREIEAPLRVVKAAFPWMKERPRARIVNVLSGEMPNIGVVNSIVGAAVREMTRALDRELPDNFKANAVVANGAAADDVARAVLFLLSSEAKAVSGETMVLSA